VPSDFSRQLSAASRNWWREQSLARGTFGATARLLTELWGFVRDSTPERRRARYGDMDYDWEHRVNTTSGSVGWRERLLGVFHSPYMPTDPAQFAEMMAALPIDFREFTFIDLGSGKGRTLLMASEYPFRKIIGIEILPELDRAAQENIRAYQSPTQQCTTIQAVCSDASRFELPEEPLVLYLFNPLPQAGLRNLVMGLEKSLEELPRPVWIVYHNALLESALAASRSLEKAAATEYYCLYRTAAASR
jgi:SAM-dependent methyltransferase